MKTGIWSGGETFEFVVNRFNKIERLQPGISVLIMVSLEMRYITVLLFLTIHLTRCSTEESIADECQQKMDGHVDFTDDKHYIIPNHDDVRYMLNGAVIPNTLEDGQEITVTYSSILESYPPQLNVCEVEDK
ncbi:hypothetical protein SAMN05421663_10358 [Terribacillus halophilus]|uniref:DUF3221 domain-containing protein n=1 Tax=Terribacillus halophilus TaxID=361279 RepID=A0A1G6MSZ8_9BACI|nr:hypothetical protein [Terribacillus halophilus]SDC58683.1 hypothetical protein SAMN05421663_10358 [Terribacillus halophilus]